jgi:hypothetical protein
MLSSFPAPKSALATRAGRGAAQRVDRRHRLQVGNEAEVAVAQEVVHLRRHDDERATVRIDAVTDRSHPGGIVDVAAADATSATGEIRGVEHHERRVVDELLAGQVVAVAEDAARPHEVGAALDRRRIAGHRNRLDSDGADRRELPPAEENQDGDQDENGPDDGGERDADPLQELAHRSPRKMRRKRPAVN